MYEDPLQDLHGHFRNNLRTDNSNTCIFICVTPRVCESWNVLLRTYSCRSMWQKRLCRCNISFGSFSVQCLFKGRPVLCMCMYYCSNPCSLSMFVCIEICRGMCISIARPEAVEQRTFPPT